jgi:NAD dependent epimerase/dehydratase
MKKVLVTGAAGFIGSHLTEALVKRGDRVRAFIRYNSSNSWGWLEAAPPEVRKEIEIVPGDLKDADAVLKAVRGTEVVYHLGALIAIPYSYVHPNDFVQTNIAGTTHVLQACLDASARLVHTSTSEVYGTAKRVPIDEEHPLQGQSPYSASKIGADKLVESFHLSFKLPVTTIRPFNTYGPRQSARAVIPTIISQALTRDRVKLGSLDPVRDLTFVDDTVRGFLLAGEKESAVGQTLNLGTGQAVSIGDLAQRIIALVGRPVTIETDAQRVRPQGSEVMRLISDPSRAKQALGWSAGVTLDDGLRRTIDWIKANVDRFKAEVYNL